MVQDLTAQRGNGLQGACWKILPVIHSFKNQPALAELKSLDQWMLARR